MCNSTIKDQDRRGGCLLLLVRNIYQKTSKESAASYKLTLALSKKSIVVVNGSYSYLLVA